MSPQPPSKATSENPPKIEFPCDYSLKIVGNNSNDFHVMALDILEEHAPSFDRSSVTHQDSRNGKYRSLRVTIVATGQPQLEALFAALKATGQVHMVL
ncbi:HP0495 family protein [Phytohalomonas tamaricis]|uniref:HP0495 family protein n=1 Tax=Phytohalomonas tamaricis TaxID=2081032 RepID=UPI000D0B60DC|nr:DUF493 domain-containing protein [Phytohalomonas tamaricis]